MSGTIFSLTDHSGCKYRIHLSFICSAYFSAKSKSDLLYTITLSSFAFSSTFGVGNIRFLGDRHIQSQSPESSYAPEVSICVCNPSAFNFRVSGFISHIKGSPPVTTMVSEYFAAFCAIVSASVGGCIFASQLSFTSHQ